MCERKRRFTNYQKEENNLINKENKINERDNNKKQYESMLWNLRFRFWRNFKKSFENFAGFQIDDLTTFEKFVKLLYRPTDPSSLGVSRALFGRWT